MDRIGLLTALVLLSLVSSESNHMCSICILITSQLTSTNARSYLHVRDVVVPSELPTNWEYKGCYTLVIQFFVSNGLYFPHADFLVAKALAVVP